MSVASNLRESYGVALMSGKPCVGKTALISRMLYNHFSADYEATIQDNMYWEQNTTDAVVVLELTDTSGSEEYADMRDKWIMEANGFVLVYSANDRESFEKLKELTRFIKEKKKSPFSAVLVSTKSDLKEKQVTAGQGQEFASDVLQCPFLETSAKDNANVTEVFATMVKELRCQSERRATHDAEKSKSCCSLQ
eukprot:m.324029 g.324029  ORF g.324029 m.324029 type:complete len:194 (-) comp31323_c0_seq1:83-664(-)